MEEFEEGWYRTYLIAPRGRKRQRGDEGKALLCFALLPGCVLVACRSIEATIRAAAGGEEARICGYGGGFWMGEAKVMEILGCLWRVEALAMVAGAVHVSM